MKWMNRLRWLRVTASVQWIVETLAFIRGKVEKMAEDLATVSGKLDKLNTDIQSFLTEISGVVADLKAQIAALQGQTAVDLTPLGDKVDALDTAIENAAATFQPPNP